MAYIAILASIALWISRGDIFLSKHVHHVISSFWAVAFSCVMIFLLHKEAYRSVVRRPLVFLLIYIFCFFVLLSMYGNHDYTYIDEYMSYLVYALLFLVLISIFRCCPDEFLAGAFWGGILLSVTIFLDVFNLYAFFPDSKVISRGAGLAENPNYAVIGLLVSYFVCVGSGNKLFSQVSYFFLLFVILTGSRYGFLMVSAIAIHGFFSSPSFKKYISIVVVGLAGVLLISSLLDNLKESDSLYRRLTYSEEVRVSLSDSRVDVLRHYIEEMDFSFFGEGVSGSKAVSKRAHNTFVNYFYDFGFFSGISFLVFYVYFLSISIFGSGRAHAKVIIPEVLFLASVPFFSNSLWTVKAMLIYMAYLLVKCDSQQYAR